MPLSYNNTKKDAFQKIGYSEVLDDFSGLAKRSCRSDWESHLRKVLYRLGCKTYLLSMGSSTTNEIPNQIIPTYPLDWLRYYEDQNFILVDPILKHCRRHFVPLFWGAARRRASDRSKEFWAARERYDLSQGVSIPLRCREMLGSFNVAHQVASNGELSDEISVTLGALFMLIPFLLEGSQRHLKGPGAQFCSLTLRETEVLKWSGAGKTTWEISRILGCSERTINFHIANASRKLGASNRLQAVGVALAQELISL
ncbi:LuxR family transcriptional regulator [Pseudomonas syringae]|uniref:helix-turn-helix transcriptional regulator n=1 Tax=Pseudomonas syringae TaxID=317 RepID=UPI000BB5E114|nr:LuxR family transcriptional regulator [Pseudomonas syringae]PBP47708.1 LuxR family transcriptional regulator [Pseudomonas syringae]